SAAGSHRRSPAAAPGAEQSSSVTTAGIAPAAHRNIAPHPSTPHPQKRNETFQILAAVVRGARSMPTRVRQLSAAGRARNWNEAGSGSAGSGFLLRRLLGLLGRLGGLLPRFRRLRAESLGEALHASLGVHQLLAAREERVTVVADLQVQLGLGRAGLPGGAAGAARLDVEVLRV